MNSSRANQILKAKDEIEVTYEGNPVWIDSVTENQATVHPVGQHENKFEVPVVELTEEKMEEG